MQVGLRRMSRLLTRLLTAAVLLAAGCSPGTGGGTDGDTWAGDTDTDTGTGGFDDHTVAGFGTLAEFASFNDLGGEPVQAKFIITHWDTADAGPAFWLDPSFYSLHDEWYWFRLLNGTAIPGVSTPPVTDGVAYASVEEVYEAMLAVPGSELPLDLRFTDDGRLYSPEFYEVGLYDGTARKLMLGSVLHYQAEPDRVVPEELWVFELEFADASDAAGIARVFEELELRLPSEVRGNLRWLARSTAQEELAASIAAGGGPYRDRTLTYSDLVVDGAVEAYNQGIVAGYVRRVPKGELGASSVGPEDLTVLEEVPDYLPPVAAIVTAIPQTPLAHLNLLAKSRGTPNAYIAGVMADEGLADWALWHTPVIVSVTADDVVFQPISSSEYKQYRELQLGAAFDIPMADLTTAPDFFDLTEGGLADVRATVPLAGGKCSGMMAFNDFPEIPVPNTPLAVTVAPFAAHLSIFDAVLPMMLDAPAFKTDKRARFLVLEGEEDFRAGHAGDAAALAWLTEFLADNPGDASFLGSLVAGGGFKQQIRDLPLDAAFATTLHETLSTHFAALADTQGLRFRSSSTAEDVQGFNGAGLYDSNSGFLHPELQTSDKLKKRTVEWALKKTWASYWSFEAFEERRVAGIDHLSGRMAVLVHPRFDDELEAANGVITLFLAREDGADRVEMIVNVQDGATSVTNPDPDDPTTPEIASVTRHGGGAAQLERVQSSSLVGAAEVVLEDSEYHWLIDQLEPLTTAWLDQVNTALSEGQHRSTLVLDFEFKRMAEGWPALASGELSPERMVLKQVRTLDSPLPVADQAVLDDDVPRDVLEQTISAFEQRCEGTTAAGEALVLTTWEYFTDPARSWALDFADTPFRSFVSLELPTGAATLGLPAGHSVRVTHVNGQLQATLDSGADWSLSASSTTDAGFDVVEMTDGGVWTLTVDGTQLSGAGVMCTRTQLLEGPIAYLQELLAD